MPSFGRLSKLQHSNRSQQGLAVDPPSLDTAAAPAPANRSSGQAHPASASNSNSTSTSPQYSHQHQQRQQTDGFPPASPADEAVPRSQQQQQQQQQLQHPPRTSSRIPPLVAQHSSSASDQLAAPGGGPAHPFAGRGQPQPQSHPAFYQAGSNPSDLQDSLGGGSPLYDTSPPLPSQDDQHQQDRDFAEAAALARSPSKRNSTILPAHALQQGQHQHQHQHQRLSTAHHRGQFSTSTTSLDDLSQIQPAQPQQPQRSPQQPQPQPQPQTQQHEKRSTRKLIRGIFSGSSRASVIQDQQPPPQPHHQLHQHPEHHQQQHQQQQPPPPHQPYAQQQPQSSYDNTSGLARRLSKRVSSSGPPLPALNTGLPQAPQPASANPDWQPQGSYSQLSSPLHDVGEAEEYPNFPISDNQQQRVAATTIRQVSQDSSSLPYDDSPQHQHHQFPSSTSQPQVQIAQAVEYDSDTDQPEIQQAHPASFCHRASQLQFQKAQFVALQAPENNRLDPTQLGPSSQQFNAETISQISHDSPASDQRSASQPDEPSPAIRYGDPAQEYIATSEPQNAHLYSQQQAMSPPSGGPGQTRRSEPEKGLRPGESQAAPPSYRHSNSSSQALNNMAGGAAPGGPPNPAFGQSDQGRNSPQPSNPDSARDAEGEKAFKELLVKYKNVKRLYFDGKAQIDALSGQVETLQNAVANQRMSASRTAWDDNEYTTRFNRLNGAINNLSFNIRKDWRAVPTWLQQHVSNEALKTGKQEMTAVGRAVISRWLMDEIFNKCFHPGLDPLLSAQLKEIELSIRGNSHTIHSQEESDALTTKVVNWRMATLDGLAKKLNAPSMNGTRADFTTKATTALTDILYTFLGDPKPAGVDGSAAMIVELAVAIAANIPLESRDVAITYPLPGDIVQPSIMEVEKTGLPSLDGQKSEGKGDDDKKNGVQDARVRFAGFLALEVKGRQVLMKAPVWT